MNKKYLSALLFGALTLASTGTFTSCKDYDDEIEDLQGQIDKQSALQDQIKAAETAIAGLTSAQEGLKSQIAAAQKAADAAADAAEAADLKAAAAANAAAEAEKNAIDAAKAALETAKAELEGSIKALETAHAKDIADINAKIADATKKLATVEGSVTELTAQVKKNGAAIEKVATEYKVADETLAKDILGVSNKLTEVSEKLGMSINSLAEDVKANATEIGKLQTRIETQEEALASYKKEVAEKYATIVGDLETLEGEFKTAQEGLAALTKRVADLETADKDAKTEIEALKAELKKLNDETIVKINADLANLGVEVRGMVTSVELMYSHSAENKEFDWDLHFTTAKEQNNNFGPEGATIPFKEGNQFQTSDKFVVRVSPVNAELKKEMISLVNSKGENLDDVIEVMNVKPYEKVLSRAAEKTGLWEVEVRLKNHDEETFDAIQNTEDGKILYAVQVNNTLKEDASRYVCSTYDLTLTWGEYESAKELNFFVDGLNGKTIANRYFTEGVDDYIWSLYPNKEGKVTYKEQAWIDEPAVKGIDGENTQLDPTDNRNWMVNRRMVTLVPAVYEKPVSIKLGSEDNNGKFVPASNIKAMYVTLDLEDNAIESAPSEWRAWNDAFEYEGLNKVVMGNETTITIKSKTAIGDIIGFRIYAVNYDGTLVDPDGKAFYVKIGDNEVVWDAAETKVLAGINDAKATQSEKVSVKLSELKGSTHLTWSTDPISKDNKDLAFTVQFYDAKDHLLFSANQEKVPSWSLRDVKYQDVSYIKVTPTQKSWLAYEDNKVYNGKLTILSSENFVLATMNISMVKVLPTTLPEGYSLRDKQVIDNVYNCYLIAQNTWAAGKATYGSMGIDKLVNFGINNDSEFINHYETTFAKALYDAEKKEYVDVVVNGNNKLSIDKSLIDNKTAHATTIAYNYGKISTALVNAKGECEDYRIFSDDKFNTIFNSFYNEDAHKWSWKTGAPTKLKYSVAPEKDFATYIVGDNKIDSNFDATLNKVYEGSLKVVDATLTSEKNSEQDYFEVKVGDNNALTLIPLVGEKVGSNPKEDVPSILTVNCIDSYNNPVVITLKMTVAPF